MDVTEVLLTEHMTPEKLDAFYRKLYGPQPGTVRTVDVEATPDPPGFEVEEQQDSFAAFAKMAAGFE
ncbi:hypothetical protein PWJ90_36645 [Nocardia gipuzkoensis]|nr:hypothetical protein [Nocardia gipuzkoensis]MDE1675136.1 hypothetical protein [Nocardia gipuzkoensis]